MTAHPRVILRFAIWNLLRRRKYQRLGHAWNQKGPKQGLVGFIKFPGNPRLGEDRCVLTTRGNGKHPWACVPLMSKCTLRTTAKGARQIDPEVQRRHPTGTLEVSRRLTKTFRQMQHVSHVTKPNVRSFDWVKGQGPSRITQLKSRSTTLNQSSHTSRRRLQHVNELISVATYRNALPKRPTNPSQAHDHRLQRPMNSIPRWFRAATINPSLVCTTQQAWVDAAISELSRTLLHQWDCSSKQWIVLGIRCQRKCHRTTL